MLLYRYLSTRNVVGQMMFQSLSLELPGDLVEKVVEQLKTVKIT
jgi:hypothetical protein